MTLARAKGGAFKQDWRRNQPVLQDVVEVCNAPVEQNRLYMAALGMMASSMFMVPIAYNKMPPLLEGALLLGATVNFTALGVLARASVDGETYLAKAKGVHKKVFEEQLTNKVGTQLIYDEILGQVETLAMIKQMPEDWQDHYLAKYDLNHLLPKPAPQPVTVYEPEAITVSASPSQMEAYYENEMIREFTAPEWITPEVITASKFIFAPKGSGKTCWLTYESVQFVALHPEATLWICDIHYDSDESNWLPGLPKDVLESKYLFTTADAILKRFRMARQILRDRAAKGLKKEPILKLMCDEFDGFMRRLPEGDKAEVAEIVQEIEDEGRKFKVFQTLVAHSGKTKQIVIDSTAINQMMIMAMGSALADPNTRLPDDMDTKKLLSAQQAMQEMVPSLPNGQQMARAIVIRALNSPADVVYVPHPDILLDGCVVQATDYQPTPTEPVEDVWGGPTVEDPMGALKEWFQRCEASGQDVSNAQLFHKFQELTGRAWNQSETAAAQLRATLRS